MNGQGYVSFFHEQSKTSKCPAFVCVLRAGRNHQITTPIDVLVNNAGYSMVGAVEETSEQELRLAMETMFFAPVALTRAVLPSMRAKERDIVQITSMCGLTTGAGFGAHCAAKHALEGLSECMARELEPLGVRVLIAADVEATEAVALATTVA